MLQKQRIDEVKKMNEEYEKQMSESLGKDGKAKKKGEDSDDAKETTKP